MSEGCDCRLVLSHCVFCDYAGPSPILDDYDDMIVIEPLDPVAPGHALIIPKRHCAHAVADPELAGRVMLGAAHYAQERGFDSCNIITSVGSAATQTVPHLHVHVVPRRPGDGLKLPWSP